MDCPNPSQVTVIMDQDHEGNKSYKRNEEGVESRDPSEGEQGSALLRNLGRLLRLP